MTRKIRKKNVRPSPEVAKWSHRLGEMFADRIGRRTSLSALSLKMSASRGFLQKAKLHKWGGRTSEILCALELLGDEMPLDVFHEAFESGPCDAKAVLACARERQTGLPPNPFLQAMAKRLDALGKSVLVGGERPWRCQLESIRRFEEVRFTDRRLSEAKLEWLAGVMIAMLERMAIKPAKAMANLACALCGLAAAYRIGGRRDDALDLLLLAHPLAFMADDPLAEGIWYQKAAYLLVDLDRCDRAYEFVQEATVLFVSIGARDEQAQTLVDLAYVLLHLGNSEAALRLLRRALPLLAKKNLVYRFAAHQLCFTELRKLGRFQEALDEFAPALELSELLPRARAALLCSRARLAVLLDDTKFAEICLRDSLDLYRQFGSVAEVAELTFEYAELLLRENRRPELQELAAGTSEWTTAIQGHRRVRELLENFAALTELRKIETERVVEMRNSLSKPKSTPGYRRPAKPQPPGGKFSALSSSSPESEPAPGAISMPASVDPEKNATN